MEIRKVQGTEQEFVQGFPAPLTWSDIAPPPQHREAVDSRPCVGRGLGTFFCFVLFCFFIWILTERSAEGFCKTFILGPEASNILQD